MLSAANAQIRVRPYAFRDLLHTILFWIVARLGRRGHRAFLRAYFQMMHRKPSHWNYDTSEYEQEKYRATLAMIPTMRFSRALELGCSEGTFSELLLAERSVDEFVGVDISARAIERAVARVNAPNARFVEMDVLSDAPPGSFDLVICAELLYYIGPVHADLVDRMASFLRAGGWLVLVHPVGRARALHAPFTKSSLFVVIQSVVTDNSVRPVELLLLRRNPTES